MSAPTLEELVAVETGVWNALAAGDAEADARLLAADFLGVYPSGFATRDEHRSQLDHGPSISTFEMAEARMRVLAPDVAMLSYEAVYRRFAGGRPGARETMYVTSVWTRADGRWTNVFSQDTPAAG